MFFFQMGAQRRDMVYAYKSCESTYLPKIDPRVTQTTLTGRVAAVVVEVCGEQPEVGLHAIIVLNYRT